MSDRVGDYKILRKLGAGGFGVVYLVEKNREEYALKQSSFTAPYILERFFKEAIKVDEIRKEFNIQFIVKIHEILTSYRAYVMEYLPQSALEYYQKQKDDEYLKQLIFAVAQIHSINIAHRDIKPENIRVREQIPVILDFGIASWRDSVSELVLAGTPCYIPPEYFPSMGKEAKKAAADLINIPGKVMQERIKTAKKLQDVYALGLTIASLIKGEPPPFCMKKSLIKKYWEDGTGVTEEWIADIHEPFQDFIRRAITFYPSQRPQLKDLIETYFYSTEIPILMSEESGIKVQPREEGNYTCLNCNASIPPGNSFCYYCGAPYRYVALHIMPITTEVEVQNLPDNVRVGRNLYDIPNFKYPTILIDLDGEDFEITIGREKANILISSDDWISRTHGRIIKKGKEIYYIDGYLSENGYKLPTNISRYSGIPVGKMEVQLEAGNYLLMGGTILEIAKYMSYK